LPDLDQTQVFAKPPQEELLLGLGLLFKAKLLQREQPIGAGNLAQFIKPVRIGDAA
jgi:hypothetical protein